MALIDFGIYQPSQDLFFHAIHYGGNISVPATKDFIRVSGLSKIGSWSIAYTDGPYMLTVFSINPDHGNVSLTLSVEVDGTEVYSATCKIVTPSSGNDNFLVGMVFDTLDVPVGSIVAKETLTLKGSASAWINYQILKYGMEDV